MHVEHVEKNPKTIGLLGGYSQMSSQDIHGRILQVSRRLIPQFVNRSLPRIWRRDDNQSPVALDEDGSIKFFRTQTGGYYYSWLYRTATFI